MIEGKYYKRKPDVVETMVFDGTPEGAIPIIEWAAQHGQAASFKSFKELHPNLIEMPGDRGVLVLHKMKIGDLLPNEALSGSVIVRDNEGYFYSIPRRHFDKRFEEV